MLPLLSGLFALGSAWLVASQQQCIANSFCFEGSPENPGPQIPCNPPVAPLIVTSPDLGCTCITGSTPPFYCWMCDDLQSGATFDQICGNPGLAEPTNFNCLSPPLNDCNFYTKCLEADYSCGVQGYPLGYGLYYCNKFQAAYSTFSPAGQVWVTDTTQCLQLALVPLLSSATRNCNTLANDAIASHAACYLNSGPGICNLEADWGRILEIIGVVALLEDLGTALEVAEACLSYYEYLLSQL